MTMVRTMIDQPKLCVVVLIHSRAVRKARAITPKKPNCSVFSRWKRSTSCVCLGMKMAVPSTLPSGSAFTAA